MFIFKTDLFILRAFAQTCVSCLLGALVIASRSGSPKYIYQNQGIDIYCNFKGRPRPQITWYKNNKPITNESESLHHKELEKSRDNGILITSSTLHVPGREEFEALYMCAANSRLSNEWSTFENFTIEVLFNCKWFHVCFINLWFIQFVKVVL